MRTTLLALTLLGCSETALTGITEQDDPEACLDAGPDPYDVRTDDTCRAEPITGRFEPTVGWTWRDNPTHPTFHQVMAAPVVGHLNDDDGDGITGEGDVPDVVFTAFTSNAYRSPGVLVALDGATGELHWSLQEVGGARPYGATGVAIADLGPGGPVVLVPTDQGLAAIEGDGTLRWVAATPLHFRGHPAVADIDGDTQAEVLLGRTLVDTDGTVLWTGELGEGRSMQGSVPVDLDGDGIGEIVAGRTVYEADGTVRWDAGEPDLWPAVGDLDGDGRPEIVGTNGRGSLIVRDAVGADVWSLALGDDGGGPPTLADFDGDGLPEIGLASREVYRVIDGDGSILWSNPVQDYSSRQTGSSVFDFEGDGAAEVVYADEETLWVWDGATGAVELAWEDHASGTLFEYPLVVDVDADGSAEIVVPSNDYGRPGTRGITIIEDASDTWAPARTVWNQHAWSIVNVRDDMTVPRGAPGAFDRWNSFRAGNSETAVGLGMPDLRPADVAVCTERCDFTDETEVFLGVENRGPGEAGPFFVSLRRTGASERLVLERMEGLAGGDVAWIGPFAVTREEVLGGLEVVVDDGDDVDECVEDDNVVAVPTDAVCVGED